MEIKRYGKALFESDTANLQQSLEILQPKFEVFLSGDVSDPVGINRIRAFVTDTMLVAVYEDCMNEFPDLSQLEKQFHTAFRYLKYYFPEAPTP
ncbi:MAG: hypothetical protein KDC05_09105, partial [Bacteroidales bacterium]|nr:hypothetical protein [Bacteroidales bacterium]